MSENYDLIVIGAGSGGIAAANRAAAYGRRVLVIEAAALGGTCVNAGCVPKKVMWFAAAHALGMQDAADYGFAVRAGPLDWQCLVAQRQGYIERLHASYRRTFAKNHIQYVQGRAQFVDAQTVAVDKQRYSAPHIMIATGGTPARPDIPGAEHGMTSDDFFALMHCPQQMVVVGGGYIAVELSCVLAALGCEVTLLLRRARPLVQFERMLQDEVMQAMQQQGIRILTETVVQQIHRADAGGLRVQTTTAEIETDMLMWAVGRVPNSSGLNLVAAGVAVDAHGYVQTDVWQNTCVEGIYAIGDVTGRAQLTPVAIAAGRRLSDRLFGNRPGRHLDYALIPSVVFSHPPLATVGLTEIAARACYGDQVKVYTSRYVPMSNAFTRHKPPAAIKLVTVGVEEKVVGCHIMCPAADEILQGFAVAMRMGATKRDFDDTVAIHPGNAEELVTLR